MAGERILVLAEGQLGDLLILTPALRALRETFAGARITVAVTQRRRYAGTADGPQAVLRPAGPGTSEVIWRSPWADEVVEIDRALLRAMPAPERLRAESALLAWMARGRFTHAICTFPQERFLVWAAASRARIRVGQRAQPGSFLLTRRPDLDRSKHGVLRYYCALAEAAGARPGSMRTEYRVTAEGRAWAADALEGIGIRGRFAVVHPGASGPYRVWPPERFAELIGRLEPVVLCGSSFDRPVIEEILRHRPVPTLETGESVDRLAGVLERAAVVVSNDSGPRHLAIAIGRPSVAVMPKYQDREWKIYDDRTLSIVLQGEDPCPYCVQGRCQDRLPEGERYGSACMRMVEVDSVVAAVREMTG